MLQEQDRQKLDGIVQQMTQNGEQDSYIQNVVNDFKSKYDTGKTSAPIKPGLLERAKNFITGAASKRADTVATGIESGQTPVETGLQFAGNTVGLGMDIAGKALEKVIPPQVKTIASNYANMTSMGKVIQSGTDKYNQFATAHPRAARNVEAIGNIASVLPVEKLAKAGLEGLQALPGAIKDIGTGIKETRVLTAEEKASKTALDAIVPKPNELTPTEYEQMVKQGRISSKSPMNPATVIPSKSEMVTAEKYKGLLQSGDPIKNTENILGEIEKHDTAVGKYLQNKGLTFNNNKLGKYLLNKLEPVTDIMIPSEERLQALKDQLVTSFQDTVKSNKLEDLWKARKSWDNLIENKLNAFGGAPTLKKEITKTIRNSTQDFITERLGTDTYANRMKEMRNLFNVLDNVTTKAAKEKGLNAIQSWIKANPGKAKTAEWLVGGTLGYEALKKLGIIP